MTSPPHDLGHTPHPGEGPPLEKDLSGLRLGDYQLLRRLGRGGMSEVYLAEQLSLARRVAFKVLRPDLSRDAKYVQRFQQEARAAAALVDAHIVQIYEVGEVNHYHYISQEYVSGQNLKQLLTRCGTLTAGAALQVLKQIASALVKASQRGIIHRDIKPENILLTPAGELKVADFGLARVVQPGQLVDMTQVGITMGTPLYMSPEQVEGRLLDPRSDLYSLGVTAYHMLAGRPPFDGENPLTVALQHLRADPPPLAVERPDLPPVLCATVHRLLAKVPDDRFASASELLDELRQLPVSDDWPEVATSDVPTTPEWNAVTQKLGVLMREDGAGGQGRKRRAGLGFAVVLAAAACLSLGASLAWLSPPGSPLRVDPTELPTVQRMTTVKEQYFLASMLNTEEGWRSVEQYFPAAKSPVNERYSLLSRQHRAELYLERGRLEDAAELYAELAELGPAEVEFRAFGLVGQANVFVKQGRRTEALARLSELLPLLPALQPSLERELLQQIDSDLRQQFEQQRETLRQEAEEFAEPPEQRVPERPAAAPEPLTSDPQTS